MAGNRNRSSLKKENCQVAGQKPDSHDVSYRRESSIWPSHFLLGSSVNASRYAAVRDDMRLLTDL